MVITWVLQADKVSGGQLDELIIARKRDTSKLTVFRDFGGTSMGGGCT